TRLKMRSNTEEPVLDLAAASVAGQDFSGAAPDIRLSYEPFPSVLFYLSAAKGYRAGGFNSGGAIGQSFSSVMQPFRAYGDDDIWTYEAGLRLDLLKDRLALRLTGFESNWRNLQTDELVSGGFPFTGNVGDAGATGIEFEAAYQPVKTLTVR